MVDIPVSITGKPAIQVAREAAKRAAEIQLQKFNKSKDITYKGRGNIVTDVDKAIEEELKAFLCREIPSAAFCGEETEGARADKGLVWIVDPIDGTRNYATGIPFFSVVVGLALDGKVLAGVTYDTVRGDMFHAERGKGAFLNDHPIHVSRKASIGEGIVGMDMSYSNTGGGYGLEVLHSIWPGMQSIRIMGSSALGLAYAAAGFNDIYFNYQLSPWDQVAALLLVGEAGGVVTDRTGKPAGLYSDGIIATSPNLHIEFMRKTEGMKWRTPTRMLT